jgi:hypothetical protein
MSRADSQTRAGRLRSAVVAKPPCGRNVDRVDDADQPCKAKLVESSISTCDRRPVAKPWLQYLVTVCHPTSMSVTLSWQDESGNKRQLSRSRSATSARTFSSPLLRWPSPPQRVEDGLGRSFGCVVGRGEAKRVTD